jgi:hypothetical protein
MWHQLPQVYRIHSGARTTWPVIRKDATPGIWMTAGWRQVRIGAGGIQGAPANSAVKTTIASTPCLAAVEM